MKNIDRLIIKAKKKYGTDRLAAAFIYPSKEEPGQWTARGDIWNGIKHNGLKHEFFNCASVDRALLELEKLAEEYPNGEDIPIFIDDLME